MLMPIVYTNKHTLEPFHPLWAPNSVIHSEVSMVGEPLHLVSSQSSLCSDALVWCYFILFTICRDDGESARPVSSHSFAYRQLENPERIGIMGSSSTHAVGSSPRCVYLPMSSFSTLKSKHQS